MHKITCKKICVGLILSFILIPCWLPLMAVAQDGLDLSVIPPLIKISMSPGDVWSSFVKVVNTNPHPLVVYTSLRDFRSRNGGGVVFFREEEIQEGQGFLLSQWIEISQAAITIPTQKSAEIPFTIRVPEDAGPGGHYAAILVGTGPSEKTESGTVIGVAGLVASLVMVTVEGDIIEDGYIREFSTEERLYEKPEVKFTVRFENRGNVHLQPRGEIKIYDFFGKEKGVIPINQETHFGNVLPESTRKWVFEWKGEKGLFEAGRYRALLTLGYGEEAHHTVFRSIYFWVVPLGPILGILGGFVLLISLVVLILRAYIRKAILIAQKEAGLTPSGQPKLGSKVSANPITETVIDLRAMSGRGKKKE